MKPRAAGYHLTLAADLTQLATLRRFAEQAAWDLGGDADSVADLVLAVNEAVTNVILHGYQGRPGQIDVEVDRQDGRLVVAVRDDAPPFDPTIVPEPPLDRPLADRPPGGLGVFLIRRLCDEVRYRRAPGGGNELMLIKSL